MTSAASVGGPMGIYDYDRRGRQHPFAWGGEAFRLDPVNAQPEAMVAGPSTATGVAGTEAKLEIQAHEDAPVEEAAPSSDSFGHDDDDRPPNDKARRRLAQNREAARKSRLRKKAYIQTLESSRLKLAQMEQELTRVRRQQGVFVSGRIGESAMGLPQPPVVDSGAAAFELEHARWVEEQGRHAADLRAALHAAESDSSPDNPHHHHNHQQQHQHQLRALVDAAVAHYDALFAARSAAARRDAFHVLSGGGAWRAPAERLFLWIGGFRPSELLATLAPQLGPLDEGPAAAVAALRRTARQLEDALSQGLDRLHQTLTEALVAVDVDDVDGVGVGGRGYYAVREQMAGAVGKLAGLASFVEQADHLRQQTLRNMHKILTPAQAARGLLALADYCQRLRALSELWAARPREPA